MLLFVVDCSATAPSEIECSRTSYWTVADSAVAPPHPSVAHLEWRAVAPEPDSTVVVMSENGACPR